MSYYSSNGLRKGRQLVLFLLLIAAEIAHGGVFEEVESDVVELSKEVKKLKAEFATMSAESSRQKEQFNKLNASFTVMSGENSRQNEQLKEMDGRLKIQEKKTDEYCKVRPEAFRDCADIKASGTKTSGVYTVYSGPTLRPIRVYCDMTTDGGGWTVFQRRKDGSVNFYRNWASYSRGFGDLTGEFWLGNENLHLLTSNRIYELRVDLAKFDGSSRYAKYSDFRVSSASQKYKLVSVGTYSGTAGNSLSGHVGYKFSTPDQDNDTWPKSCAVRFKGAWWYEHCHSSNLNGAYLRGPHPKSYADGVEWSSWTGAYYSLKFTEMKIRPKLS